MSRFCLVNKTLWVYISLTRRYTVYYHISTSQRDISIKCRWLEDRTRKSVNYENFSSKNMKKRISHYIKKIWKNNNLFHVLKRKYSLFFYVGEIFQMIAIPFFFTSKIKYFWKVKKKIYLLALTANYFLKTKIHAICYLKNL